MSSKSRCFPSPYFHRHWYSIHTCNLYEVIPHMLMPHLVRIVVQGMVVLPELVAGSAECFTIDGLQ